MLFSVFVFMSAKHICVNLYVMYWNATMPSFFSISINNFEKMMWINPIF